MHIRSIIIDDEELARKRIRDLLADYPFIEVLAECNSGVKGVELINQGKPDLIFLDIQLMDLTAFDLLRNVEDSKMPLVIFITAYDHYAIQAFDHYAVDYLVKPFRDSRFKRAMDKLLKYMDNNQTDALIGNIKRLIESKSDKSLSPLDKRLVIKSNNKYSFLTLMEIVQVNAAGPYVEIITASGKKHVQRTTMINILEELGSDTFVRIHRSSIINLNHLKEVSRTRLGEVYAVLNNGQSISVGKTYKKDFMAMLNINE